MKRFLLLFLFALSNIACMEQNSLERRLNQLENNHRIAHELRASRDKAIIEAIAITRSENDESALRLKALEEVALDEFSTTDKAFEELQAQMHGHGQQLSVAQQRERALAISNQDLTKKIVALENQIQVHKNASTQEIQSLNNQTTWLRWALGLTAGTGAMIAGCLFALALGQAYRNSELSDDIEKTKTDHKNLVNALLGKKSSNSINQPTDVATNSDLNKIAQQVKAHESRIEELEKEPTICVDADRRFYIDGKKVHNAWVAKT